MHLACKKRAMEIHQGRFFLARKSTCLTKINIAKTVKYVLARDVIYTSRAYAMMPVRLSVTQVHWRIIANLGFKFRSHFTAHCGRRDAWGESSRAMLASARLFYFVNFTNTYKHTDSFITLTHTHT